MVRDQAFRITQPQRTGLHAFLLAACLEQTGRSHPLITRWTGIGFAEAHLPQHTLFLPALTPK
eukprot:779702-Pleurochrysis_carterae.AAC.1